MTEGFGLATPSVSSPGCKCRTPDRQMGMISTCPAREMLFHPRPGCGWEPGCRPCWPRPSPGREGWCQGCGHPHTAWALFSLRATACTPGSEHPSLDPAQRQPWALAGTSTRIVCEPVISCSPRGGGRPPAEAGELWGPAVVVREPCWAGALKDQDSSGCCVSGRPLMVQGQEIETQPLGLSTPFL